MSKARAKGTDAENKVRDYAISRGFKHASRMPLAGANDKGDIRLGDGIDFTLEVKGGQGALSSPHQHLRELRDEIQNAGTRFGAVIAKKAGSTKVGEDWVAMMPVSVLFDILDALYPQNHRDAQHVMAVLRANTERLVAEGRCPHVSYYPKYGRYICNDCDQDVTAHVRSWID